MAKILHVAGFSLKPKGGAFLHSVALKLSNGFIRNGHSVINFSDRDVARASALLGHRKFGVGGANKALLELCRHMEPDLLVFGHADIIRAETILSIRALLPDCRVVQWNVDPLFEEDNLTRISRKIEVVDATLVSTAGALPTRLYRPGKPVAFLPNPVDFSIESGCSHQRADLPYDLFYACGGEHIPRHVCGAWWKAEDLIGHIETAVPGLRTVLGGIRGAPILIGASYQKILASVALGLNISRRNDRFLYSSDRLAQMTGNGLAILIDRATGYDHLFGEDEFAFFSTVEELTEQVRRLTQDAPLRQRIAGAGRSRYYALFNEGIVAKYVVDLAFGRLVETDYPWPTVLPYESPNAAPASHD
ncbi:MAG TPA: glycosyltransferase [Stellaceae bacterium]|jgi:hypothetical protein|nr:glycosyltransferase [Stellaceae bacterium]